MTLSNKNVLIITGTRAEYGLLKPLIIAINKHPKFNMKLLATWMHTLSNYWNTIDIIKKDWVNIDCIVPISDKWNMISWLSEELIWIDKYLSKNTIDLIILLWDRNEPLAWAITAAHYKIPVAHIHWWDVTAHLPDEYIRNSITKFSHLHFTSSNESKKRVIAMWEKSNNIYNIWAIWLDEIKKTNLLSKNELSKKLQLKPNKKWLLILHHPTMCDNKITNYNKQISAILWAVELLDYEIILIYPNSDEWSNIFIEQIENHWKSNTIHIFKSLDRNTYLSLLNNIEILIWNSSSWIIESWIFNLPVVNVWNRQKWRECWKNIFNVDYNSNQIKNKIDFIINNDIKNKLKLQKNDNPYYNGWAVNTILKVINSYDNFEILFEDKLSNNINLWKN